jgi:predicted kinase
MFNVGELENIIEEIADSPHVLYILCGFPYAGKTYLANQILRETDIVFISIDDIFYSRGFDWDTNKLPNEHEWQEIFDESYRQTKETLKSGKGVLYDSTNQTIASRDVLRAIAKECGVDTQIIYVKSDIETVWKRWEENQKNPSRSIVKRELVQMTIDTFEEPTIEEGFIVIEN